MEVKILSFLKKILFSIFDWFMGKKKLMAIPVDSSSSSDESVVSVRKRRSTRAKAPPPPPVKKKRRSVVDDLDHLLKSKYKLPRLESDSESEEEEILPKRKGRKQPSDDDALEEKILGILQKHSKPASPPPPPTRSRKRQAPPVATASRPKPALKKPPKVNFPEDTPSQPEHVEPTHEQSPPKEQQTAPEVTESQAYIPPPPRPTQMPSMTYHQPDPYYNMIFGGGRGRRH